MLEIKENIYREIEGMDTYELLLLYNQIRLIKDLRGKRSLRGKAPDLEEIHKLTSSSKSSWSESVILERRYLKM